MIDGVALGSDLNVRNGHNGVQLFSEWSEEMGDSQIAQGHGRTSTQPAEQLQIAFPKPAGSRRSPTA